MRLFFFGASLGKNGLPWAREGSAKAFQKTLDKSRSL